MLGEDYPVTVTNFVENIKSDIYKNKKFYKIINYPQVNLIYSGINPESNFLSDKKNQILNKIPPKIPLEITLKKISEPKYKYNIKDPAEIENIKNTFEGGSIAMVKSGKKNSSSTEFFFVTNKFPELDGRYAIFGKIVKGFEILKEIDQNDIIYEIKIIN